MASTRHYSVIVVGAGPVGLLTTINLARLGVNVLVVERGEQIDQSPRATSYQPCVLAEMHESGILEDVKKKAMKNNFLSYWVGRGPEKKRIVSVEKLEGGDLFPWGINCGQPVLAETILDHLLSRYKSEVRFSQRVVALEQDDKQVYVTCENPQTSEMTKYTCDWLIGADGAGSRVRSLLGIEFQGFSWPKEGFCASNIRYPFEKFGFTTANFLLDPIHWAVITVIDDTGLWRCAFGVDAGKSNEKIRAELDEHYKHILPGWPGPGYELVQLNRYKPHQRCASTFRKGRCFLAGDAAHSNNPIGGLGLTTGLLDGGPLGRALGEVANGRAPESILDVWANQRRTKWLTYTNQFSIENKRLLQKGGYGDDPRGIWKLDQVSKAHGMDEFIKHATPAKEAEDLAMLESLTDEEQQLIFRLKQWDIAMDPKWMAEYEDPEVVTARVSCRPIPRSTSKSSVL